MPSQAGSEAGCRRLVAAGTARFEKLTDNDLPEAKKEVARVASAFSLLGYENVAPVFDPDHHELRKLYSTVGKGCREGDLVVAYYCGHGVKDPERFYLLTRDSDPEDLEATAVAAEDLARDLCKGSKASQILMILDACYAGAGAAEIQQIVGSLATALGGSGPEIYVIAAARPRQEADVGALSSALAQALANADERVGGGTQQFLVPDELIGAINVYLKEKHPKQVARLSSSHQEGRCRLFPNPRYRDLPPGLDLQTRRAFANHWVPKARSAEIGASGWYFTGREQALRELAAWLREEDSGGVARVVTGGAGSGKSAVLGRIVTLADRRFRSEVLDGSVSLDRSTLPPAGVVDVAVHARRKLLADVVAHIALALNVSAREPAELIEVLARRQDKSVIVVDALDEADEQEQIVSQLLCKLVGLSQIFLLVGTRPDSFQHGKKFRALGESVVEIDLDDPRYIGANDIARYVERRLLAAEEPVRETPYRQLPEVARTVAYAVARRARNVFLVAHTAVIALLAERSVIDVTQPGWIDRLPTGFDDAFERFLADIDRRHPDGLSSARVRAVLLPLAFAEGEGLPWVDLWAAVAHRVSDLPVRDADIALVREHAAAFVVEAMESDRSVYRLYHESIANYLLGPVDVVQGQRHLVSVLRAHVPVESATGEPDWRRAHPYTLAHLASHALKGGIIGEVVEDGMFLAATELRRTLSALAKARDPFAWRAYSAYALAFRDLSEGPIEYRLPYLQMAARRLGDDALADLWMRRGRSQPWSVAWMHRRVISRHRVIPAGGSIECCAFGTLDGQPVIVSGGSDGRVRVWDLESGTPRGEPFLAHRRGVYSLAIGTLDGHPVIVSGGEDGVEGTIQVWDLASGTPRGERLRAHRSKVVSIAMGTLDGRSVIVSGGSTDVIVWDLMTGERRGEPLVTGLDRWNCLVSSVAVGALDGHPVIVSGGTDGVVQMWDLESGAPLGEPLLGQDGWKVALGMLDGRPVMVLAGQHGPVRVCDLATGALMGQPLRGHSGGVNSVAVGTFDGRAVIVTGGHDHTVRVWELASGTPLCEPLLGFEAAVSSVAMGALHAQPVIVASGLDGTVRVWDLASVAVAGEPARCHEGEVHSVAIGALDGRPMVVSGGEDKTIRVWDLESGAPQGEPLRRHRAEVRSVAVGRVNGQPVIVSGGDDGSVRVWDLASGKPRGEPLRGHEAAVRSVTIGNLDGQPVIVSGGEDTTVCVWDLASGEPRGKPLRRHRGEVTSVAVGTLHGAPVIVSGDSNGTVRLWDLASGAPCGKLSHIQDDASVSSVAMGTVDGQWVIVSGGDDGRLRMWDAQGAEYASIRAAVPGVDFLVPGVVDRYLGINAVACTASGWVVIADASGLTGLELKRMIRTRVE